MGTEAPKRLNFRVCIVSPLFHPNIGGPGRQAFTMVSMLKRKGIVLMIITRRLDVRVPVFDGIEVSYIRTPMPERHNLSEFTFPNFLVSVFFSLGAMIRLLLWRKRYDIVQFYGASLPLLICLPLLKVFRKRVVAKLSGAKTGMEAGSFETSVLKYFLPAIFSRADRLIVMSDELRNGLLTEKIPAIKIAQIPNGVDIKLFYPFNEKKKRILREAFGFSDKRVVVYCGRLVDGKGLDILLDATGMIVRQDREVHLVLLGDGPLRDKLMERALSLQIMNNVHFKNNVNNVYEFFNASDLFVLPSFKEGMPNSLLEAMACGLPVIASRIGGVVDVVEDGKSGILFEPGDVSGLASAIVRLLNDSELRLRLGKEARKRIIDNFSIERIADEYIKLYSRLMADS